MSRFLIYALHHDSSPHIYVGRSSTGLQRPREHGKEKKPKFRVGRWAKKLREQGERHQITVLEEHANAEQLNDAERFYIAYFKSIGASLLNLTAGGDGLLSASKETRERLSRALTGRVFTEEWKEKISKAKRGNSPIAHIVALNKSRIGIPLTDEYRKKLSVAHKSEKATKQREAVFGKRGEAHPRARLSRLQVEEIRLSSEASRSLAKRFGVSKSTIYAVRSGQSWGAK